MNIIKSVNLVYRDGGSDKVYHAAIVETDGTYTVQVEWGRRGSVLSTGTKADKVDLLTAEKAFNKVIKEKTGKGYLEIPGEDGKKILIGLQATGERENLGITAQLMNPIEDDEVEKLILDDNWIAQRKYDGVRILTHIGKDGKIQFTNRKGQVTGIHQEIEKAAASIRKETILDGEVIPSGTGEDSIYYVFDALKANGEGIQKLGYEQRYDILFHAVIHENLNPKSPIKIAPCATGRVEKRKLINKLREEHAEGVVFKKNDAPYVSGRPNSGGNQLKLKFTKTADVFLTGFDGKAYQMVVMDGKTIREVGRVYTGTTIGERKKLDALLKRGEQPIIEVRYLYATEGDILFQPVYVRLRTDKDIAQCAISQLIRTNRKIED